MRAATARESPAIQWRLFENLALCFTLIALWLFGSDVEALSLVEGSRLTTVIALATTIILVRGAPRGMWSPSAVFFIILVLCHVGLVAAYVPAAAGALRVGLRAAGRDDPGQPGPGRTHASAAALTLRYPRGGLRCRSRSRAARVVGRGRERRTRLRH